MTRRPRKPKIEVKTAPLSWDDWMGQVMLQLMPTLLDWDVSYDIARAGILMPYDQGGALESLQKCYADNHDPRLVAEHLLKEMTQRLEEMTQQEIARIQRQALLDHEGSMQ